MIAGIPIVNAMTVDVEDYFHATAFEREVPPEQWPACESRVEANTNRLLEQFRRANVRATFFVLGWVAERCPALVRRIAAAGHEIASHGYAHRLVYDQTPKEFRDDVRRAKAVLERLSGREVSGYRAPSYSITRRSLWAVRILAEEGYRYDSSVFPIRHDRYGIPGAPRHRYAMPRRHGGLWEIPPATACVAGMTLPVGGGGYFRLLPYAWTRWGIARINNRERRPAMFYLHPWEIDADQPRLPAGWATRVRHYHNLTKTASRLERLLAEFRFGSVEAVYGIGAPALARAS